MQGVVFDPVHKGLTIFSLFAMLFGIVAFFRWYLPGNRTRRNCLSPALYPAHKSQRARCSNHANHAKQESHGDDLQCRPENRRPGWMPRPSRSGVPSGRRSRCSIRVRVCFIRPAKSSSRARVALSGLNTRWDSGRFAGHDRFPCPAKPIPSLFTPPDDAKS